MDGKLRPVSFAFLEQVEEPIFVLAKDTEPVELALELVGGGAVLLGLLKSRSIRRRPSGPGPSSSTDSSAIDDSSAGVSVSIDFCICSSNSPSFCSMFLACSASSVKSIWRSAIVPKASRTASDAFGDGS